MDKIIFSEFPPHLLNHFSSLQTKFNSHRLMTKLISPEFKVDAISVLLIDMVTFSPLVNPIRGTKCQHMECFDESSAEFCLGAKCPLCEEMFDDYEKDEYLIEILSKGQFEGVYINCNTGLFFPFSKKTQEIQWNLDFLKYLAIKNAEILPKVFSYYSEKNGIGSLQIKISFCDEFGEKIIETPCRTKLCDHLNCTDLKEIWMKRSCKHCGLIVEENNIYIDLVQYGVFLFARTKLSTEKIKEIGYFSYFPEYQCFQIGEEIFDLELKNISFSKKMEILGRIEFFRELQQKSELLDRMNTVEKKKEEEKEDFQRILEDFHFPDPTIELMELHYDNIEREINSFLNEKN